ncbi:MAG TPA: hypothetical protein PKG54_18000 [Phycisphaerae bacterium]|jgi:hypothetical protein|nr:hypothetical protein [Phycisphaerae bacterium]HOB76408.1 hypothetical protein [Phycisphaerae bacterium]HOJ56445.1 hypothetical protein [Phycisphaerae bacterium]HOL25725.1 hypothetical protein [Phycisphaerae bacterium]HPP19582.1 hypothetical protein [Phycisphaerae bacterium]
MKAKRRKSIAAIFREGTSLDRAMVAASRDAIRRHKQAGVPMAIWRDGKVVLVDAAELESKPRKKRRG